MLKRVLLILFVTHLINADVARAESSINIAGLTDNLRVIRGVETPVKSVPVAKILARDSMGSFLCSGVLISPKVVMTASHCVVDKPSDMSVYIRGAYRGVSKIRVHPKAHESLSTGFIYNDVALLFLRRPVNGQYYSVLSSHMSSGGDSMTIYGFGIDENEHQGTLKQGTMTVDAVSNYFIFANYDGSTSNTCNGDSGGPAVMSYVDSVGKTHTGIVGITSGGEFADCGVGDRSYFANIQNASTMQFLKRNVEGLTHQ